MNSRRTSRHVASPAWPLLGVMLLLAAGPAAPQEPGGFAINAGLAGAWANVAIPGQGLFVDIEPDQGTVFVAWFTFADSADEGHAGLVGHPGNRWYVAQGSYVSGASVVSLALLATEGGGFNDPAEVATVRVGNLTLDFASCTQAIMEFSFDRGGPQGRVELMRLSPAEVCESLVGR